MDSKISDWINEKIVFLSRRLPGARHELVTLEATQLNTHTEPCSYSLKLCFFCYFFLL